MPSTGEMDGAPGTQRWRGGPNAHTFDTISSWSLRWQRQVPQMYTREQFRYCLKGRPISLDQRRKGGAKNMISEWSCNTDTLGALKAPSKLYLQAVNPPKNDKCQKAAR